MEDEPKESSLQALPIASMDSGKSNLVDADLSFANELIAPNLQLVLKSRYLEAKKCIDHSPMATIMLCGSLLEGLLLGIAQKHPADFNKSSIAPKTKETAKVKPFNEWALAQFIDVAHELGYIRLDVKNFNHELRNFRNYIHPYQQLKEDFNPDQYTAQMCLTAVEATIAQLRTTKEPEDKKLDTAWETHPEATNLALLSLLGYWNEKNENDVAILCQLLNMDYSAWLPKARDILHLSDSPLSLKNGIWMLSRKEELLYLLESRVLDQDLETFKDIAESVLKEQDPAFDLPTDERYAASIHGKVLKHSGNLRQGISEGLALLGNHSKPFTNCSLSKAETVSILVVRELLDGITWQQWATLNNLLPNLAEAAPNEFIEQVEKALLTLPCPFDEVFAQEGNGLTGGNYLTGLLWALEGLAWDEQYLVRICCTLGELAIHDPGGNWANRPSNSIVTILLPWLPQTLAPVEKRKVAIQSIITDNPDIGWKLLLQLLPSQHQTSSGSHKPTWRNQIPEDWEKGVAQKEYWDQVTFYAELAVDTAGKDYERVLELIDYFDHLPAPAFDKFITNLSSEELVALPEKKKQPIWDRLIKFTTKHRKFSDAKWAMPDESLVRIESLANNLAPIDPFNFYQYLFSDRDFDLFEEKGNWDEQRKNLDEKRQEAISKLLAEYDLEGVIKFSDTVLSPRDVGHALGAIADSEIDRKLLPVFLTLDNQNHKAFISAYLWRRHNLQGWEWADNLPKVDWTKEQLGQFLSYLPFEQNAWDRAQTWLQVAENEYWVRTPANGYQTDDDLHYAIEKLIQYGRPRAAIDCLGKQRFDKQTINNDQCLRALLAGISSDEPTHTLDQYHIVELIKHLQSDKSADESGLFKVEWAYLPLLDGHHGATPALLESKLANDPEFFCELIQLIYRSKKEEQPQQESSQEKTAIAINAWELLRNWKIPAGTELDGGFNPEKFENWCLRVKEICSESGHLEVALIHIGEVLIHAPADNDGLWIHRTIAHALNTKDAEDMRSGYSTGTFNARGAHIVDPTGAPEKELAEQFRQKADKIENQGFQRFAVTVRNLADNYDHQAQQIIFEHQSE